LQNFRNFSHIYISNTKNIIYIIYNIKSGWAGPKQLGRTQPQKCWADLGPKNGLGRFRPRYYYTLLGQTRPRRLGWARTSLAQQQTLAGGIIFPPPFCMQNVIRSACRNEKKENAVMKGGGRITWHGGGGGACCVSGGVVALRWKPVVVSSGAVVPTAAPSSAATSPGSDVLPGSLLFFSFSMFPRGF
jgi:hypothetical protein